MVYVLIEIQDDLKGIVTVCRNKDTAEDAKKRMETCYGDQGYEYVIVESNFIED